MWLRLQDSIEIRNGYRADRPLDIRLDHKLAERLRKAAESCSLSTEELITTLLIRGLEEATRLRRIQNTLAQLTPRERQILQHVATGATNRQIAAALVISPETVKTHIRHILNKFSLSSKIELQILLAKQDRCDSRAAGT